MWMLWSMLSLGWAEHVAVLEFTGSEDEDLVSILSDQARAGALDQLDPLTYSIITRENMMQILNDMGKDATCVEGSCEVELARNIGADLVISGTMTEVGGVQMVMLKLHQSDTGTLLAMERVQGTAPIQLVEETSDGVRRLLRKGLNLSADLAKLTLTATPNVTVYMDDSILCQQTPCVRDVEVGSHTFRWEGSGSQSIVETLSIAQKQSIHRSLDSNVGQVFVMNAPKGIDVYLDGASWKQTPIQAQVALGTHTLSIEDACYQSEEVTFTLTSSEQYRWTVNPKPRLTQLELDARSNQGRSVVGQVYADGVLIGNTGNSLQVPLCTEEIKVAAQEGEWTGKMQLKDGQNRLSVALASSAQTTIHPTTSMRIDYPMVNVSVGRFWMGSTNSEVGRNRDEQQHQVMLTQPFAIGTKEVTQGVWEALTGQNPSQNRSCGSDCPVENISWCDAVAFANLISMAEGLDPVYRIPSGFGLGLDTARCNQYAPSVERDRLANGYRLPTEAEWEYSAREMGYYSQRQSSQQVIWESHRFSGSSSASRVAWYDDNAKRRTHAACGKEPNLMDLCDMSGNVFEWVEDWYEADTSLFSNTDPWGPNIGTTKVLRGGSYQSPKNVIRNAFRYNTAPGYRDGQMGLRLVRNLN